LIALLFLWNQHDQREVGCKISKLKIGKQIYLDGNVYTALTYIDQDGEHKFIVPYEANFAADIYEVYNSLGCFDDSI